MARRKRGMAEEDSPKDAEMMEILEALPENELKINFQDRVALK